MMVDFSSYAHPQDEQWTYSLSYHRGWGQGYSILGIFERWESATPPPPAIPLHTLFHAYSTLEQVHFATNWDLDN